MKCKKCKKVLGRLASGPLCRRCRAPKTTAAGKARAEAIKQKRLERSNQKCLDCEENLNPNGISDRCPECRVELRKKTLKKICGTPGCDNRISKTAQVCRTCHLEQRPPAPEFGRMAKSDKTHD